MTETILFIVGIFLIACLILAYLDGRFAKCDHKWVESVIQTESIAEQKQRLNIIDTKVYDSDYRKFVIQIHCCSKCGKIKRYKTKI